MQIDVTDLFTDMTCLHRKPGDLEAYKTAAKAATANIPGKMVSGGTVGRIPMANAIIPPA